MSDPDLAALAQRLSDDPKDALTIEALADWLEERGAEASSVRALTVEGPTVLVFGVPSNFSDRDRNSLQQVAVAIGEFFRQTCNQDVMWVLTPAGVTIRQIRAERKEKANP